ncbi:MAG: hypothetical protein MJZ37_00695 [Bacilli bacterium]|nr:hypothetical protein [Bacilli bacterium]
MLIRQEEKSPICDAFDKLKLTVAFKGIEEQATSNALDSELLKTYCDETIKLLRSFQKSIEAEEREMEKQKNKNLFKEKLYGNDPYGD